MQMGQALFGVLFLGKGRVEVQIDLRDFARLKKRINFGGIGADKAHISHVLLHHFLRGARNAHLAVVNAHKQNLRPLLRRRNNEISFSAPQIKVKRAGLWHKGALPYPFYGVRVIHDRRVEKFKRCIDVGRLSLPHVSPCVLGWPHDLVFLRLLFVRRWCRYSSAQLPIMTKLYVICHQTFVCKRRNCDNLGVQHNKHLANQN